MSGHHHHHSHTQRHLLWWAFWINFIFLIIEFIGGLITNSLALLSDAGHMLTDVGALGIAIAVSVLSEKPRTKFRSYGYMKAEIFGAFINGATLVIICGFILYKAYKRFGIAQEIDGPTMLIIAVAGLIANVVSAKILAISHDYDINIKGAYLHLMFDALGSVGAIISAVAIWGWDWYVADIIASIVIVLFILYGTRKLLFQSINMLMDAVPENVSFQEVKDALLSLDHVLDVHDLHIWAISQSETALSAHITLTPECTDNKHWSECLTHTQTLLKEKYNISHTTLQMEPENHVEHRNCE